MKKRRNNKPKKTERNPLISRTLSSFQYGRELLYDTDIERQLRSYRSWVYCASSLNAQSVAQTPIRLYFAKPARNTKSLFPTKEIPIERKEYLYKFHGIEKNPIVRKAFDIEEVVEHPILDLFRKVNNFNNSFDLWEMTDLYQELTGNAYWLILNSIGLKIPQEIWLIPPGRITPIPDPETFISGYKYKYGMTEYTFREDQIIHFKFPNPANMYLGVSPLVAGIGAYNTNENMQIYNNAMFKNMGKPSGFFETDDVLDEDDFNRTKQEIQDVYAGVQNVGKVGLLDHGLKFEELGMNPAELAFIEGKKATREEIFNMYGQSIALWSENPNRANADAAERQFYRRTIRPRCIRMAEKITEKLIPRFDPNLFIAFDDPSTEDQLIAAKIRQMNTASGITTINEERKKLHLPSYKSGGDEPLLQIQYAPLSLITSGAGLKNNNSDNNQSKPKDDEKQSKEYIANILTKMLMKDDRLRSLLR